MPPLHGDFVFYYRGERVADHEDYYSLGMYNDGRIHILYAVVERVHV